MGGAANPHRNPRIADNVQCEGLPRRLEWLAAAARDLCVYCGCETWMPWHRAKRRQICLRLGIPTEGYRCDRLFHWRMATCEHLERRVDGGGDEPSNLALACVWCNSSRQDLPAAIWAIVVAGLVAVGRHPCVQPAGAEVRA